MSKIEDLLLYNMVLQNDIWIPNKNPITKCAYAEREKQDPVKQLEEARKALEKYKPKEEPQKLLYEPIYDFGKDFERRMFLHMAMPKIVSSDFYPTLSVISSEYEVKIKRCSIKCVKCGKKRYFSARKGKKKLGNLKCRKCKGNYAKNLIERSIKDALSLQATSV